MRTLIRKGFQKFEMRKRLEIGPDEKLKKFRDMVSAHGFLRGFMRDNLNNTTLRKVLSDASRNPHLSKLDDKRVLDQIARQLMTGRLQVVELPRLVPGSIGHGLGVKAEPPISGDRVEPAVAPSEVSDEVTVVTPKIEVEYKVVLLDRKIEQHQEPGETKIYADSTWINVYADQSDRNHVYKKGGKLKCSPANVEVYLDEKCQNKLAGDLASGINLKNDQLTGARKLKLYLKGKAVGKFKISLELEEPGDKALTFDKNSPSQEMGVVELKMLLHQHNASALGGIQVDPDTDPIDTYYTNLKNKALPDQKEMTDAEKVKAGRLLYVQKDNNFGRAKLLCKKLDSGQWPAETDDYEIVINETSVSGAVEMYDAEWNGTKKAFPVKIKVSDLKSADKAFWVQGKAATKKSRDVRLNLELDRPAGGLAKKAKRNADCARFTVAEIKEVKVDYTAQAGKANAWDSAQQRFYINFKSDLDGRKLGRGYADDLEVEGRSGQPQAQR